MTKTKYPDYQNIRDDGTSCWVDTYGRGAGYGFWWPFESSSKAMERCEKDEGDGNCEWNGAIVYPKCKKGYHNIACCLCEPDGGPRALIGLYDRYYCKNDWILQNNGAGIYWCHDPSEK